MNLPNPEKLEFDPVKHCYRLNGKLLSGVTSIIDGTSSKANLIQWAANMAVEHIEKNFPSLDEIMTSSDLSPTWFSDLLTEAKKAHTKRKESAGTKGTDTHALVEEYILSCVNKNNGTPYAVWTRGDSEDAHIQPIKPFVDWAYQNNVQFLVAEQRLYSETHGYAGTCDFVAVIDGKLTIGDLKTFPKMWSADPFIQMGAYSKAWHEMTGERPEQSVIVKMCDPEDERIKKYGGQPFSVYPRYALEEDEEMFLTRLKMYRYNNNFVSPKD